MKYISSVLRNNIVKIQPKCQTYREQKGGLGINVYSARTVHFLGTLSSSASEHGWVLMSRAFT